MDWNLEHAPIDVVTVLDVSGNMNGTKLTILKKIRPTFCCYFLMYRSSKLAVMIDYQTRASEAVLAINDISLNLVTHIFCLILNLPS